MRLEVSDERFDCLEKEKELLKIRNGDLVARLEGYEEKIAKLTKENMIFKEEA